MSASASLSDLYSVTQASGWPASVKELSAVLRPQAQGAFRVGGFQGRGGPELSIDCCCMSVGAVLGMSA